MIKTVSVIASAIFLFVTMSAWLDYLLPFPDGEPRCAVAGQRLCSFGSCQPVCHDFTTPDRVPPNLGPWHDGFR